VSKETTLYNLKKITLISYCRVFEFDPKEKVIVEHISDASMYTVEKKRNKAVKIPICLN